MFHLAGEVDIQRIIDVVSSVMKAGALAGDRDLSLSCGVGLLLHMLLYPHPSASEPADAAGMFSAALALYQKVVPAPLLADWWVETCGEVDATSVRVCEIQSLFIEARFAAAAVDCSWWRPLLEISIACAKVNAAAGLSARPTIAFMCAIRATIACKC